MWSKPAPPSDSGKGTPVSPSSAAFLKSSRGKCPVSSCSFASGRTSDSANSRTLFCNNFCSSVSSRSTVAHFRQVKNLYEFAFYRGSPGFGESGKRFGQTFVSGLQIFRVHARLARDRHEVRITHPSRQNVQMQMSNYACARGAAQVHSQIHPIGLVTRSQGRLR